MSLVVVMRNTPGSAVSTYANPDKSVKTVNAAANVPIVDEKTLEALLSSREPFTKVAVATEVAQRVLGWTVTTQ